MHPRATRKNTRPGSPTDLLRWLRASLSAAALEQPVLRLRVLRTSSEDIEQWRGAALTSFASLDRENDPDVRRALTLGFDVVRRDAIGDSTRADLGDSVFVLRMHHAPRGAGRRQVGVILLIGQTLFLYLLSSARAGNLQAENQERSGNAATEFIAMMVREMEAAGRRHDAGYRPEVHARDHDRIVRSEYHGSQLKTTLKQHRAVVFAPHRLDLTRAGDSNAFTFGSLMGAAAADALIRGMNRQEVVLQANGGFYEDIRKVPFTHGPLASVEVDPRTQRPVTSTNVHRLTPVDDVEGARDILRQLVDKILEDKVVRPGTPPVTDWAAVGVLAARLGLPSRRPVDIKNGVMLAHLGPSSQENAVRSLFAERYIDGWRHGSYVRPVKAKTELDLDLGADVEIQIGGDGSRHYLCRIDMPLPEGGWGITDDEWDRVLQRRYPGRHAKTPRRVSTERLPFAGLVEWDDEAQDRQFQLTTKQRYILRSRPLDDARGHDGVRRGWDGAVAYPHLGTLRPAYLHASVGEAMQSALQELESQTVPASLTLATPTWGAASDGADLEQDVNDAKVDLEVALDQRDGAEDTLNAARGRCRRGGTQEAVDRAEAALQRAERAVDEKSAAVAAAQAAVAARAAGAGPAAVAGEPSETEELVDSASAELTAVALTKCEGSAPPWLQQACHWFLDEWRMHVHHEPGERPRAVWECQMTLRLVESDHLVRIPLTGAVVCTGNTRTGNGPTSVEDWAWRFFYCGEDMVEVAQAAGTTPSHEKNSYIYSQLLSWLEPAIPNASLRTAALHCPIPATRRVIYHLVTGDPDVVRGLDPAFVDHIRSVYTSPTAPRSWTWCRDNHELARSVCDELRKGEDGSRRVEDLVRALSSPLDPILSLARETTKPTGTATGTRVPYVTKNFARGRTNKERRLFLRPCPHHDCPARIQGGQGYASVPLRTPETEVGYAVLCPDCDRLPVPALGKVYFPKDYQRPWSGRFGSGSKQGARNSTQPTFLQPGHPDPGPGQPPPDTGCTPRARAAGKPKRSGRYIPRHERAAAPLGARTFLPVGLTGPEHSRFANYVTGRGGVIAQRLRPSVAAVVVSDTERAGARVERARELGVPVLGLIEFVRTRPETWVTPQIVAPQ